MFKNTEVIKTTCDKLNIKNEFVDQDKNILAVFLAHKNEPIYFVHSSTPFNTEDVVRIARDKDYTNLILGNSVKIPRTLSFLDPNVDDKYAEYIKEKNVEEIIEKIESQIPYPLIIKKNSGEQGQNVFLVKNTTEAKEAFTKIFNKEDKLYDHIALAQEYFPSKKEYRVIVFKREIVLIYEKDTSEATFEGNLSPLHYKDANAVLTTDEKTKNRLADFIAPIWQKINLGFGGLDIAENESGELCLFEINTKPGFEHFAKDNGIEALVEMYRQILKST